jgi:serine/threonine protein kinase
MDITAELTFTPNRQLGGGQGRNSTVWAAHDHQLNAEIVVKQVERAKCSSPDGYFAEARRLYYVRHPNVVDVKYACSESDYIWLAMPYYVDGSLHSLLEQRFLTAREIVKLGLDFLGGLHHVHVKRLVHLDVKPTNVLIGPNFTAALADFGVARHLDANGLTASDSLYDKHLPPEALLASMVGTHSDIYQAGLTLYRMCNGLAHFEQQIPATPSKLDDAIVRGKFPDRRAFLPHIPQALRRIVKRALDVDPDRRYATVLDLMNDLAALNNDSQLDWAYTEDAPPGTQLWTCDGGTYEKRIELVRDGGTWDGTCSRRNHASGRVTRVAAHCTTGMVSSEVASWVEGAIAQV